MVVLVKWLLKDYAKVSGFEDVLRGELREYEGLVERGYGAALERLRVKRGKYGIDCRVVPDNQLLCIEVDNEVLSLLHGALVSPSIVMAALAHMGMFMG